MGWSGGTEIFDRAVGLFLDNSNYPNDDQIDGFVLGMYDVLTDADWDTVDESRYVDLVEEALGRNNDSLWTEL